MTDQSSLTELVLAARAGDQTSWNAIVDRFTSLLWAVARAHRLDQGDAADVVQNTWLRLVEHLDGITEPEALPGWLTTTARREAWGVLRRRKRELMSRDEDLPAGLVDPEAAALDAGLLETERDRQLWASFAELSPRCQRLLRVLMATDPPAYREVSQALGIPVGSIGPTRMRCLDRLRDLVDQSGYAFDDVSGGHR